MFGSLRRPSEARTGTQNDVQTEATCGRKHCHVYQLPVSTMFIGAINLPFPVMACINGIVAPTV